MLGILPLALVCWCGKLSLLNLLLPLSAFRMYFPAQQVLVYKLESPEE